MARDTGRGGTRWAALMTVGLLALGTTGAALWWFLWRGPAIVETTNASGQAERCTSCHPSGKLRPDGRAHPQVSGHRDLMRLGCGPCHGGQPLEMDQVQAHQLGTAGAFLGTKRARVACARCHTIGAVGGMALLQRGRRAYLEGSCIACHRPGAGSAAIGIDLRLLPPKPTDELQRLVLHPTSRLAAATMWSLQDATYRGLFSDTPRGRSRLAALTSYVTALGDNIGRQAARRSWHGVSEQLDLRCRRCHLRPDAAASDAMVGAKHRCTMLRESPALDCKRCHGKTALRPPKASASSSCPQLGGALPLCATCHLVVKPPQRSTSKDR